MSERSGYELVRPAKGATSSGRERLAKITGRAGVAAPWLYTGVQVRHDGGASFLPENFIELVGGDDLAWRLVNLQEIGDSGLGVMPVDNGAIVRYWALAGRFDFSASGYKGTY